MTPPTSLAIIGAGITGLSAAFYAKRRLPDLRVTIFDAADRVGGVLQTVRRDGFLLEQSADSFLATDEMPWARQLIDDLGLSDQLISVKPESRRALVARKGRLYPVPSGFNLLAPSRVGPILRSRLLSWPGKLRLLREAKIPPRVEPNTEESLEAFAVRRVGREAFERLVQPLVAGIYAADPTLLSIDAALPKFVAMERNHGSLTRALRQLPRDRGVSGARYSKFLTLRDGLAQLTGALGEQLSGRDVEFERNMSIDALSREPNSRWRIAAGLKSWHADALIVATPAAAAARLLRPVDGALSDTLHEILSTQLAIVCLTYKNSKLGRLPIASGFVVPALESSPVIAVSFSSRKFEGRAPNGYALMRVFLGGAASPGVLQNDDHQLQNLAHEYLTRYLRITGDYELATTIRWHDSSPQYHLGHQTRVSAIRTAAQTLPGFALAGNYLAGVGLPQCVRSGMEALEQVGIT